METAFPTLTKVLRTKVEVGTTPATPLDSDADGVADYLDTDSDADGISDTVEAGSNPTVPADTDADGIPDFIDLDSDGDTVSDAAEGTVDSDADGIPDVLDTDANNDGISDQEVAGQDFDNDGIVDTLDSDIDGDGIPNTAESNEDTDNDGIPNYEDTDSDGDGIPDSVEGTGDLDGDGIANFLDLDSDGDGIPDAIEGEVDSDADGSPDYLDTDSDDDGLPDNQEAGTNPGAPADSDGDGIPDYVDVTDSTPVVVPSGPDSDNDGIADLVDLDDDNDGIPDSVEIGNNPNAPVDSDGDGIPDYLDRDSDNDGLTDSLEAGGTDTDGNGIVDGFVDANGDGLDDGVTAVPLAIDDFDNDGIVDFLDLDSDNDGLSDLLETAGIGADKDFDGRIDGYIDENQDGIDDAAFIAQAGNTDTDRDGQPDQLDLDRDNDGKSDLEEAGGVDQNGDGIVDALQDADADGIPDSVDVDVTGGNDADNDGIDDTADSDFVAGATDIDNDGIIDSLDPDNNGDGFVVVQAVDNEPLGASLPDTDGDGVPDISEAVAVEWQTGIAGSGCSVVSDSRTKADPALLLLLLGAVIGLLSKARKSGRKTIVVTIAAMVGLSGCSMSGLGKRSSSPSTSDTIASSNNDGTYDLEKRNALGKHFYAGIGVGSSTLEPKPVNDDTAKVTESQAGGGQLTIGFDFNKWFSAELHGANLGSASLSTGGSISYQTAGASALFYAGKSRHHYRRNGFSGYGRLGYGMINSSKEGNVNLTQLNKTALLVGAGLEYSTRIGLGIRGELFAFDQDARYMQLGLVYRFGKKQQTEPPKQIVKKVEPEPAPVIPAPAPAPVPAIAVAKPADADEDGVLDATDRCPNTAPGAAINSLGCALLAGVIDGVNFQTDSATLTASAKARLDEVTPKLQLHPTLSFELSAHTDNVGTPQENLKLSRARAISVAKYLLSRGVAKHRFKVKAYGESRPIASNDSEVGRSKNRRVELTVLKKPARSMLFCLSGSFLKTALNQKGSRLHIVRLR